MMTRKKTRKYTKRTAKPKDIIRRSFVTEEDGKSHWYAVRLTFFHTGTRTLYERADSKENALRYAIENHHVVHDREDDELDVQVIKIKRIPADKMIGWTDE